jgi:small-conductance mechanosensitive channel
MTLPDRFSFAEIPDWGWTAIAAALSLVVVLVAMRVFRMIVLRTALPDSMTRSLVRRTHAALTVVVSMLVLTVVLHTANDDIASIDTLRHYAGVLLIASITFALLRAVRVGGDAVFAHHSRAQDDDLRARSLMTQARVLTRTLSFLIVLLGVSATLMMFPQARQIGTSLLASAGIAGLAVGLAAKPVLGNLLAGLQIGLTQPIRIGDVLLIEGEWGRVEEITGTYVVFAVWDQRRLIVPLQYFIEKPFQNWTRTSAQILGTVMLWVDYRLPVDAVRQEAERLCKDDPDWDGRLVIVHVTETNADAMQVRVLVSSADSPRCFELRCRVREGLIAFVARDYPDCLPRLRAQVAGDGAAADTGLS